MHVRGVARGGKGEREIQETPTISCGKTQMSLHIIQGSGHRFAALNNSFQGSFPLFSPLVYLPGSDSCGWGNLGILSYFALLLEVRLLFFSLFLIIFAPSTDSRWLHFSCLTLPDHPALFRAPHRISVSPSLILVRTLASSQISWTQDKLLQWWTQRTIFWMLMPSMTESSRGGRLEKEKDTNASKCLSTIHWYSHSESRPLGSLRSSGMVILFHRKGNWRP